MARHQFWRPWCLTAGHAPVLYAQTGCAESRQVRAWLTERRITSTERNVTGDYNAAKALLETGIFGTPRLSLGTEPLSGSGPTRSLRRFRALMKK